MDTGIIIVTQNHNSHGRRCLFTTENRGFAFSFQLQLARARHHAGIILNLARTFGVPIFEFSLLAGTRELQKNAS
jgi:hypothetical protein